MTKDIKKNFIYVLYQVSSTGGDPVDDSEWSERTPEDIELSLNGFYFNEPGIKGCLSEFGRNFNFRLIWDELEVDEKSAFSKTLYLVILRYGDGDTFGTSSGHHSFLGATTSLKLAESLREAVSKDHSTIDIKSWSNETDTMVVSGLSGYKCFNGYFSSYEGCEIATIDCLNYPIKE